jgi:3-deoxy-D-manno-octulosonate 8-phosphate phosphatase KdsC-like HAD superfamily phosphatase
MKKIIFLDIDGVLATNKEFMTNRTKFRKKYPEMDELKVPYAWNKDAVKVFNEILDVTGAEIVLSSDWKLHWDLDDLKKIFEWNGVKKHPIAVTNNEYTSISNLTMNRAAEIEDYVRDNDINNYVVIDDLNVGKYMGLTGDDDKFFMTISAEGIKKTGLKERIIKKLNE